ncbi:MAG: MlaD family protein [Desulfobacterales bacterium]|nr:MlaD family protein [Desulfobacterales bacterium]
MSKKANTALIGAFVIGGAILAVVGILAFGSGALFKHTDEFVLYFEGDLTGLAVGSTVVFQGVPVGQVKTISVFYESAAKTFQIPVVIETDPQRFHEINPQGTEVQHEIEPDELDRLIKAGLRGQLSLQSLVTGQLVVSLSIMPNTPVNFRGDGSMRMLEIPTVPSSFERLAAALKKLDLPQLAENINRVVEDIGKAIDEGGLQELLQDVRRTAREFGDLAVQLQDRTAVLTAEVQATTQTARGLMNRIENQVDPVADEAVQTMEEIQKAMVQAEKTLVEIQHLAVDYSADSDFGFELSTALNEVAATARSVRALTDMLQQQPDALLRGKTGSEGN